MNSARQVLLAGAAIALLRRCNAASVCVRARLSHAGGDLRRRLSGRQVGRIIVARIDRARAERAARPALYRRQQARRRLATSAPKPSHTPTPTATRC